MTAPLAGRTAVVTGAAGGIGRGVARCLAAAGASVVVNGRDPARAEPVLREIEELGSQGIFVAGDVRSSEDMAELTATAVARTGGLDIVVASAGGADDIARDPAVRGPFDEIDLERVTGFVGGALGAKLRVVQAAVPHLRARGGGSVVFVTSEGGRTPTPGQTAMAASSGGLIVASKVLATELARDAIRVNCVCVTVVRDSPSWSAAFEREDAIGDRHRRQYEKIIERSPLGVAAPDDIGEVVTFLAGPASQYLTGATVSPTGGLTLHSGG